MNLYTERKNMEEDARSFTHLGDMLVAKIRLDEHDRTCIQCRAHKDGGYLVDKTRPVPRCSRGDGLEDAAKG